MKISRSWVRTLKVIIQKKAGLTIRDLLNENNNNNNTTATACPIYVYTSG